LGRLDRFGRPAEKHGETARDHGAGDGILLLSCNVAANVVRRLVPHDEGQFISVPGILQQGDGEGDDGPAGPVERLKGIRWLSWPVVDEDPEIAIHAAGPCAAFPFRHRFNNLNHVRECVDSTLGWRDPGSWLATTRCARTARRNRRVTCRQHEECCRKKA
jgi:hypothetical protein